MSCENGWFSCGAREELAWVAEGQCWVEVAAAVVGALSFSTVMIGALNSCALPSRILVDDVTQFLKAQGNLFGKKAPKKIQDLIAMPMDLCLLQVISGLHQLLNPLCRPWMAPALPWSLGCPLLIHLQRMTLPFDQLP
jgi:hypothetical protein